MSYCIKCGVELEQGAKKCPLCNTPVRPAEPEKAESPLFPAAGNYSFYDHNSVNRSGVMFVITLLTLIPVLISLLCDWNLNGGISWSAYVAGALMLIYGIVLFPLWFKHPNPVIFTAVDFVLVGLFLLLIDLRNDGGWFLSFAFPVTAGCMLITVSTVTLTHYLKKGYLYIFSGMFLATGAFSLLLEFLLNITFHLRRSFTWSYYPLVTCAIIGGGLLVIAICRPLRESLHRKFFI